MIWRNSNPRPFDREPSLLPTRPDFQKFVRVRRYGWLGVIGMQDLMLRSYILNTKQARVIIMSSPRREWHANEEKNLPNALTKKLDRFGNGTLLRLANYKRPSLMKEVGLWSFLINSYWLV